MEQGPGAATGGSFISLSENEQRCYSGLYTLCQADSSGKLASSKVGELFRASQLPAETLHQITEVCGAKRLGYFGTGQFYVALKLLAAAQSGLPVRLDSITGDLPLPIFSGAKSEAEMRYPNHSQSSDGQAQPLGSTAGPALRTASDRPAFRQPDNSMDKQEPWSPPRSPCTSPPQSPSTYCRYSVQRNGTEMLVGYEGKPPTRPAVLQENSSPSHYAVKPAPEQPAITRAQSTEKLPDRATDDYSDDPWRITEEQHDYYTNQFKNLQADLGGLIRGTVAKNFFTKSKLPIHELSHIWELSDVDRDGALTFPEFCTAFHLIVARKNGYPLPEKLPPSLRPGPIARGEVTVDSAEITQPLIVFEDTTLRATQQEKSMVEIQQGTPLPGLTTSKQDVKEEARKPELSPKRAPATQEKPVQHVSAFNLKPDPPNELDPNMKSRTRPRSYSSTSIDDAMKKAEEPPTPPPRPQKSHSRASSLDLNKLFQQGSQGIKSGWLPPPPALPPRPPATQIPHFIPAADKSSQKAVQQPNFADFSRFREEEEAGVHPENQNQSPLRRAAGPSTEDLGPPKAEPSVGTQGHAPQKPVRRKYRPESQNLDATPPASAPYPSTPASTPYPSTPTATATTKPAQKLAPRQKREIQTAIRKNKEANAVLTRLNSELQQKLKVVHQERVTLESQLEVLRPLTSS
ncbi:ralBP1-associated Eps domain-containing protein 2 isoform X2 [Clupea harengus]|uniref:RalBP1-associated Eps domain-containing protein 2 isoform X2 n=1 Tax=Clupea harengus TaxID=7950 RepID=A0A6P8G5V3_CLUHA|nr:ralBP1-associated Eps domain-containing protein 2 isoform X2 [Clupea harengus]